MNSLLYKEAKARLIERFPKAICLGTDKNLDGQFNMVSAGLLNFMPSIAFEEHEKIFRNLMFHKQLSSLEQQFPETLNYAETEGFTFGISALLTTRPTIICTFHTGSYRIINHFLIRNKIPFSLVVGKAVLNQDGAIFSALFKDIYPDAGEAFKLIDAESPGSGLQMLRELKKGRSLLIYIDGNTGAGTETTNNNNSCTVRFLEQEIAARLGMAYLSHASGAPIIPIACYRKSLEKICLRFFDPLLPGSNKNRFVYAKEATQQLFDILSVVIKMYPEQWEGWLYIHKVARIVKQIECANPPWQNPLNRKLRFNKRFYGIIEVNDSIYLFSKNTYSFYEINNTIQSMLSENIELISPEDIPEAHLRELFNIGALTYC